jgi:hypothetical protein
MDDFELCFNVYLPDCRDNGKPVFSRDEIRELMRPPYFGYLWVENIGGRDSRRNATRDNSEKLRQERAERLERVLNYRQQIERGQKELNYEPMIQPPQSHKIYKLASLPSVKLDGSGESIRTLFGGE